MWARVKAPVLNEVHMMKCKLCGHSNAHKHGTLPSGTQRYRCPLCQKTFTESFDTLYYRRHVTPEQIRFVLQCHAEGSSLRAVARTTGLAYNTVVSLVRSASHKAQQVHNVGVSDVETDGVSADELWSFVKKSKNTASRMS